MLLMLFGAAVVSFHGAQKIIEFNAEFYQPAAEVFVKNLIIKRSGFIKCFQVVDAFIIGSKSINDEPDIVLFIVASAISFHNRRFCRLRNRLIITSLFWRRLVSAGCVTRRSSIQTLFTPRSLPDVRLDDQKGNGVPSVGPL